MRHAPALLLATLLLCLCGCSVNRLMEAIAPEADRKAADRYIDLLREKRFGEIERDVDPGVWKPGIRDSLAMMSLALSPENPVSNKLVGLNTVAVNGVSKTYFTFEREYPGRWLLVNIAFTRKGAATKIIGFGVVPLPDSLEHANRFSLAGKGRRHLGFLGLILLMPLISVVSLVRCVRADLPRAKWFWLLFILFGIGVCSLNWTTGKMAWHALNIQFLSAGAFRPFYGPWTLSFSLPVGAVVFLILEKRLTRPAGRG